jgi:FkbM family methyltransferase
MREFNDSSNLNIFDAGSSWLDTARKLIRSYVPTAAYNRLAALYNLGLGALKVGPKTYLRMQQLSGASADDAAQCFRLRLLEHPIWLRPGTPDVQEFIHTVIRTNYGRHLPREPVRLIIDAGAYIGDTTVWYLNRFPQATVIALEPNPRSFSMLERNCREYGQRAILLQAALWPCQTRLELNEGSSGTVDASVREVTTTTTTTSNCCVGVTVEQLLSEYNDLAVDIFKCDIEGAEVDLFSNPNDEWVRRTRSIYVDVHSEEAKRVVAEIATRHNFVMQNWRELVILHR